MDLNWIPSLAFVALFSFLFVRDYRFWRELKRWPSVKRMKERMKSTPVLDREEIWEESAPLYHLLKVAEHNLITSIIGMVISAVIMAVDVCLIVVGS